MTHEKCTGFLTPVPHVHHNHLVHQDHHEYDIHLVHLEDHVHHEQLVHLEDHLHQRARGPLSSVMFASVDVDNLPCVSGSFYLEIIRVGVFLSRDISCWCLMSTTTYKQNHSTTKRSQNYSQPHVNNIHQQRLKMCWFIGTIYRFQFCSDTIYI